jgi:phage shock protein A
MAKARKAVPRPLADLRKAVGRMQVEGERLAGRIEKQARTLVRKGRAELVRDVARIRTEVGRNAAATLRRLETRVLKELHGATSGRVARLERRMADLEAQVDALERRAAGHAA